MEAVWRISSFVKSTFIPPSVRYSEFCHRIKCIEKKFSTIWWFSFVFFFFLKDFFNVSRKIFSFYPVRKVRHFLTQFYYVSMLSLPYKDYLKNKKKIPSFFSPARTNAKSAIFFLGYKISVKFLSSGVEKALILPNIHVGFFSFLPVSRNG